MLRAWVSPEGELHEVSDANIYSFCTVRGLHYQNMLDHMERATSDHKNGGWRLIERLRAIGHVNRPHEHVLAFGTPEAFHKDCLDSDDGRSVLKDPRNLGKLTAGSYKGGKPWNKWECRKLSVAALAIGELHLLLNFLLFVSSTLLTHLYVQHSLQTLRI